MLEYMEPVDERKARTIAQSIRKAGWNGPPIVVDGLFILNGHHRYFAATRILRWDDDEIPTVDIREIFNDVGMDWDQTLQLVDGDYHRAVSKLPIDISQEYGW